MSEFSDLIEYCKTDKQREYMELCHKHGSLNSAHKKEGISRSTLRDSLRRIRELAAKKGYSPKHGMTHPIPDGFSVKGTSTLYDKDGNQLMQWQKTNADAERQIELMQEVIAGFKDDLPVCKKTKNHKDTTQNPDLLNLYVLTDYHLGMLSWGDESGADWDTEIAEETLVRWFKKSIEQSPQSSSCLLGQLGDFLHYDGMESVTPSSGHVIDADSRFQKIVRVAIRVLRKVIEMLAEKYDHVYIVMATGNHDLASSVWLREFFSHVYQDCDNITVDNNPDIYYCHEHGKTSLFFHHGHKKRVHNVSDVFVGKYREVFGRTIHSYAHLGHLHHNELKEDNLMITEQHRTLAAKDAHASQGGYLSGRDSKVITYHKEYGEVGRITINYNMIM